MEQTNHFINLARVQKNLKTKIKRRGDNCRVYKIPYRNKKRDRLILLVKCKESYSDPKGHLSYLRLKPKPLENVKNEKRVAILTIPMRVYCNCPAFLYWGSKYNATVGKYLIRSFGQEFREPNIRDPRRENKLCKHLSAVRDKLSKQSIKLAMKGNVSKHSEEDYQLSLLEFDNSLDVCDIEEAIQVLKSYIKEDIDIDESNFFNVAKNCGVIPDEDS